MDAIGFYQENRDHDESVYHKMEKAHALNDDLSGNKLTPQYEEDEFGQEPLRPEHKVNGREISKSQY